MPGKKGKRNRHKYFVFIDPTAELKKRKKLSKLPKPSMQLPELPDISAQYPILPSISSRLPRLTNISTELLKLPDITTKFPKLPGIAKQSAMDTGDAEQFVKVPSISSRLSQVPALSMRLPKLPKITKQLAKEPILRTALAKLPKIKKEQLGKFDYLELLNICSNNKNEESYSLQIELNKLIARVLNADLSFMMFPNKNFNTLLMKVIGETVLEEINEFPVSEKQFLDLMIKRHCFFSWEFSPIQFEIIKQIANIDVHSFMCVPIIASRNSNKNANAFFLACAVNKRVPFRSECFGARLNNLKTANHFGEFNEEDKALVKEMFSYATTIVMKSIALQEEKEKKEKHQVLSEISKNMVFYLNDPDGLLNNLVLEIKELLNAERCSVYVLEKSENVLVGKIIDGLKDEEAIKVKIPINNSIIGECVKRGSCLNIWNAHQHPLFYRPLEKVLKVETKNILCFPIKHHDEIVAVIELCNKKKNLGFTTLDEELSKTFAIYFAMSII